MPLRDQDVDDDREDVDSGDRARTAGPSTSSHNRNPGENNQYKNCPSQDDPQLHTLLRDYDRRGITNRAIISKLLNTEHNIQIGPVSIQKCLAKIGLKGSRTATRATPGNVRCQLVLDQMVKDPTRRSGPRVVKEDIVRKTGVHLTRNYVEMEMCLQDPEGFVVHDPTAKKVHHVALIVLGPQYE